MPNSFSIIRNFLTASFSSCHYKTSTLTYMNDHLYFVWSFFFVPLYKSCILKTALAKTSLVPLKDPKSLPISLNIHARCLSSNMSKFVCSYPGKSVRRDQVFSIYSQSWCQGGSLQHHDRHNSQAKESYLLLQNQ